MEGWIRSNKEFIPFSEYKKGALHNTAVLLSAFIVCCPSTYAATFRGARVQIYKTIDKIINRPAVLRAVVL